MSEQITIRAYSPSDKEDVLKLLRMNTPEYFSESEEEGLIDYLENHLEKYYVLELEGKLVGCGGFNFSDDKITCKISWDIFHPNYQGKGLGTALTNYRIDRIKEYPHIEIISVRTSQLVYKFYEKFGFELKEVVKDYWAEGFDLYYMVYLIKSR